MVAVDAETRYRTVGTTSQTDSQTLTPDAGRWLLGDSCRGKGTAAGVDRRVDEGATDSHAEQHLALADGKRAVALGGGTDVTTRRDVTFFAGMERRGKQARDDQVVDE